MWADFWAESGEQLLSLRKVDNKLTFLVGVEDLGAEDDKDGSSKELHDAGQSEECGQN